MSAILNAHTAEPRKLFLLVYTQSRLNISVAAGNESVPIQLAQCRFTGLAISSAKIQMHFPIKYTEVTLLNSTRKLLWFEITKMLTAVLRNKFIVM